jgi:hypothetical protein
MTFKKELEELINKYSKENGSDTPDFILAEYLYNCLLVFDVATIKRENWYGHESKFSSKAFTTLMEKKNERKPSKKNDANQTSTSNVDGKHES